MPSNNNGLHHRKITILIKYINKMIWIKRDFFMFSLKFIRSCLLELTFRYPTRRHAPVRLGNRITWRHMYYMASSTQELRWIRMREYMWTWASGVPRAKASGRRTPSDRRSVSGQVANNDTRRSIPSKRQNPLTLIYFWSAFVTRRQTSAFLTRNKR